MGLKGFLSTGTFLPNRIMRPVYESGKSDRMFYGLFGVTIYNGRKAYCNGIHVFAKTILYSSAIFICFHVYLLQTQVYYFKLKFFCVKPPYSIHTS